MRPWAKDTIHVSVRCKLDWKDRLRALIHGKVNIDLNIDTDKVIERSDTDANCWVPNIFTGKPVVMAEVHEPDPEPL